MAKLKKHGKGIVLMHDFQHANRPKAAMDLLNDLKGRPGLQRSVFMKPKFPGQDRCPNTTSRSSSWCRSPGGNDTRADLERRGEGRSRKSSRLRAAQPPTVQAGPRGAHFWAPQRRELHAFPVKNRPAYREPSRAPDFSTTAGSSRKACIAPGIDTISFRRGVSSEPTRIRSSRARQPRPRFGAIALGFDVGGVCPRASTHNG